MVWNKDLPDGSDDIADGDDDIRTNNDALETALDAEHGMATGGNQSGRHKFPYDDLATLNALSPVPLFNDPSSGVGFASIALATTPRNPNLVYWDGSEFLPVDVGTGDVARIDERSQFTRPSVAMFEDATLSLGTGPGGIDEIDIDLNGDRPALRATITGDTIINNPSNNVAGGSMTILLELTMDGTGGHTITFGTSYRAPGGTVSPPIGTAAAAVTHVYLTTMNAGGVAVSTVPTLTAIP